MKLSEVCIQRPVLAWVFTLVVLMMGIVGFSRLPVQKNPNIESVFITIETQMPGVGPDIIETQITRHIEDAVSGIEGIETTFSTSAAEDSKVVLEFRPGRSMDNAMNDVRDRLSRVKEKLPQANLRTEPTIIRSKSDERPVIYLALTSEKHKPAELYDVAENDIKKDLESIAGVARIDISGASAYVMKIDVDPLKMSGYKVNVEDVRDAIESQNFETPAGRIESKNRNFNVTTKADLTEPEEFDDVIVRQEKNSIVRIKDIGRSYIDADDKRTRTRFNGNPGVQISITKQSNANPLQVAKDVKAALAEIQKTLPSDIKIDVAADTTKSVEKSIKAVYWSIIEASILVILVVLIFLRSARASIIPLITIPVSIIGVAFLMYILGYTINTFTLFAMVLAVGLVVDDAIVVLENIHRHIEEGSTPYQAAFKGVREIGFSVIAMTLTLVAVYLPIPLGSGKLAKFFTEFAITLAGSVVVSGFVALTLSPMMCARLLVREHTAKPGEQLNWWQTIKSKIRSDQWLDKAEVFYENLLRQGLIMRSKILLSAIAVALVGAWVFIFLKSEFEPLEDTRSIRIDANAPTSATLEYTERYMQDIDNILKTYPEIERRITSINNPNVDISLELTDEPTSIFKQFIALFKPHERTTDEISADLEKKLKSVTGLDPKIKTGGQSDVNMVQFVVRGNKTQHELISLAKNIVFETYQHSVIRSALTASMAENEDYIVTMKRDKIANINKRPIEIAKTIRYLIKGEKVNKFKRDNKQYDVNVQVFSEFKESPEDILRLYTRGGTQKEPVLIPFSELVNIDSQSSPHEIIRYNRQRASMVSAILSPGNTIGDGIKSVEEASAKTLPEGSSIQFINETQRYITESRSMYLVFFLSLFFIYLVLAAQFESWRDPFIIFFSVPFSLVGGVFALTLLDKGTLNMYSFIGFVTLIGLITKHGILIVDFANRLREHNTIQTFDAIVKASRMRLRPILMTTFAMVLGAVPLMFGGAGNESRRQLGSVIIGGMSIGTIFTLIIVPIMYTYLTSNKRGKKMHLVSEA